MREKARIDRILKKLGQLWKEHPDQRLGQLLENYVFVEEMKHVIPPYGSWVRAPIRPENCIFHVEDNEVEKRIDDLYTDWLIMKED